MFDVFLFNGYSSSICKIGDKNVAMILKNGTKSLEKFCRINGHTITSVKVDPDLDVENKDYIIDVYFRDPVDRYFSALNTVKDIYKLPNTVRTLDEVSKAENGNGFWFDNHFFPQYWFMISAYIESWNSDRVFFRFHDFNNIGEILGKVKENVGINKDLKSAANRHIVKQRYVYDAAIYHQLLGETLNYPELLDFFSKVTDGFPRVADYVAKTSPVNHAGDTQKKVDYYNQALDQLAEIAKKSKKY